MTDNGAIRSNGTGGQALSQMCEGSVEVHAYPSSSVAALLSLRRSLDGGSMRLRSITPTGRDTVGFSVQRAFPVQLSRVLQSVPEVTRVERRMTAQASEFRVFLAGSA